MRKKHCEKPDLGGSILFGVTQESGKRQTIQTNLGLKEHPLASSLPPVDVNVAL